MTVDDDRWAGLLDEYRTAEQALQAARQTCAEAEAAYLQFRPEPLLAMVRQSDDLPIDLHDAASFAHLLRQGDISAGEAQALRDAFLDWDGARRALEAWGRWQEEEVSVRQAWTDWDRLYLAVVRTPAPTLSAAVQKADVIGGCRDDVEHLAADLRALLGAPDEGRPPI